jgi:hypothetical protein
MIFNYAAGGKSNGRSHWETPGHLQTFNYLTTTLPIMTASPTRPTRLKHIISKLNCFDHIGLISGTISFDRNGGLFAEMKGAGFLQVVIVTILAHA